MRRARVAVVVHLIWATWDRLPLVTEAVQRPVYRCIEATCQERGVTVMALGGVADHVHLLIDLPATLAISDLLKHVKGTSSHLVTQHLQPGQFFKWQGAYAAFSVDPLQTSTVIRYIVRQAEHHAAGTLIPAWELPPPSEDTSV